MAGGTSAAAVSRSTAPSGPVSRAAVSPHSFTGPVEAYISNSSYPWEGSWGQASVYGMENVGLGTSHWSVSVIDNATHGITTTMALGVGAYGIAVSPDGSRAYVGSYQQVSVVDTATHHSLTAIPVGTDPLGLAVSPDGSRLYVANHESNNVSVVNTATNQVVATVNVGTQPYGVVVSPNGQRVYVTDQGSNQVSVIDTGSNAVTASVSLSGQPGGLAMNPAGSQVYVPLKTANAVAVLDTSTNQITSTIPVGAGPVEVAMTPNGAAAYVSNNGADTVSVITTSTQQVSATVAVGVQPFGVSITPDGGSAYVVNSGSNNVSIINVGTHQVTSTVPVGSVPREVAFVPARPIISTATLPSGTVGQAYSSSFHASGGAPPYTWSVVQGAVPAGLQLHSSGVVDGTPTQAGAAEFFAKVTDANGSTAQEQFWISIKATGGPSSTHRHRGHVTPADSPLSNGLLPKPPMGTNPYGYDYSTAPNPAKLRAQADELIKPVTSDGSSLADLGYTDIQLDAGWSAPEVAPRSGPIDPVTNQHTLEAAPATWGTTGQFTDLLHEIENDYVSPKLHKHLQVGIYSDWGSGVGCPFPESTQHWSTANGLFDHEVTDARTFASWGISFLKIDGMCGLGFQADFGSPPYGFAKERERIRDAFAAYAPDIAVLHYWEGATPAYSNLWRLGGDECGCFTGGQDVFEHSSVLDHLDEAVAANAPDEVGPGSWDDMDNLLLSGTQGAGGVSLTTEEQRSQFGIEALEASPLLVGTDLRRVVGVAGDSNFPGDPTALGLITNTEVIAVDQDGRGDMGRIVEGPIVQPQATNQGTYQVLSKVLASPGQRAVGLLNRTNTAMNITVHFNNIRSDSGQSGGLTSVTRVRDLWTHSDIASSQWSGGSYTVSVPAHGIDVLQIWGTSTS